MTACTLAELAAGEAEWRVVGDDQTTITDVQYDSRLVKSGVLFAALRGGYVDGHDFIESALERGAAAIMVEQEMPVNAPQVVVPDSRADLAAVAARFFRNPSCGLRVIGITGTDGKTTTSYIVDHILRSVGRQTGMVGTVSVRIGGETVDHETRQTTPESVDNQRLLRQMVDAGVTDAILEATSHGLELHRLDHTRFEIATVTNITQEHLEYHKSIQAYWRAKARLFERVSRVGGEAVVNLDDAGARSVLPYAGGCRRILTYSLTDESADLRAEVTESGLSGSRGLLHAGKTTYPFEMPLVGAYNVSNSLAALGTAMAAGVELGEAVDAIRTVPPVPGRMTAVDAGQPFGIIVDYAHTPESLDKVLRLLRSLRPDGRLIVVFGSAGERDPIKRPIQGRVAAELSDIAIITNEDPRFEDAESIIREIATGAIEAGAIPGQSMYRVVERRDAVALAIDLARTGDTILLAGKGHERSIIWNGVKHPWDETAVAYEELAKRGWQ